LLEYVQKRLGQVADSLIEPVWKKLLASPWWLRVLFLLLIVPIAYGFYSPKEAVSGWRLTTALARVAAASGPALPLSPALRSKARDVAKLIAGSLQSDINEPTKAHINPWVMSQDVLATSFASSSRDSKRIAAFMRANADVPCACWRAEPENAGTAHVIFISGWVLATLGQIGERADPASVDFLLSEQSHDGWWSMYPVAPDSLYASSYTTAWALLGLKGQLSLIPAQDKAKDEVSAAIQKASAWLLSQRESGSRWKDYPLISIGKVSVSISGVVIHALHQTVDDRLRLVDTEWLDALPSNPVLVSDSDHHDLWFQARGARVNDSWVQAQLPWMLVATADAYPHGNLWQRARALQWVEQELSRPELDAADTLADNWWRAELLFSLEYLLATSSRA